MKSVLDDLWPTCAVCNKTVESLETAQDFCTLETVFVVSCHGDREFVRIPRYEFQEGLKLEKGIAFTAKRISTPIKEINCDRF